VSRFWKRLQTEALNRERQLSLAHLFNHGSTSTELTRHSKVYGVYGAVRDGCRCGNFDCAESKSKHYNRDTWRPFFRHASPWCDRTSWLDWHNGVGTSRKMVVSRSGLAWSASWFFRRPEFGGLRDLKLERYLKHRIWTERSLRLI